MNKRYFPREQKHHRVLYIQTTLEGLKKPKVKPRTACTRAQHSTVNAEIKISK